jgi:hypothetical protein
MRSYEASTPRISFGIAAVALSVVTFALTVMLPAQLYSGRGGEASTTLAKSQAPKAIEVAIIPSRITVTAPCEQAMASEPARRTQPVVDRES